MILRHLLATSFFCLVLATYQPAAVADQQSATFPPLSGIAHLQDASYIAVLDAKAGAPDDSGQRLILLQLAPDGTTNTNPIPCDWSLLGDQLPSDLESITALPNCKHEFLAVESSYYEGKYGRILRLALNFADGAWGAKAVGIQHFPQKVPNSDTDLDNIEGSIAFSDKQGKTMLLLAKRGKNEKPALILSGPYNPDAAQFTPATVTPFDTPFKVYKDLPGDRRYASDLALVGNALYAVSCNDPGDEGPFTSQLYQVGKVHASNAKLNLRAKPKLLYTIDNHKVEAVLGLGKGKNFILATDDEKKGGAFIRLP